MQWLLPENSVNLARYNRFLAVERLFRDTPETDQPACDIAAVLAQRADNEAVRGKSREAPYYHRRTQAFCDVEKLFFHRVPGSIGGTRAADVERRQVTVGSEPRWRGQRTQSRI
jgi:hypothetical protein